MHSNEGFEQVRDLNERFLCLALNVEKPEDLLHLSKIELQVDTSFHNLEATGELLANLYILKLNDSIVGSFRDLGTSFRNI
jgi:hypothetical protein